MRLRKYIAFAGMAVLMLCSCNEMENAPTNKFTDNSYWTSTTKAQYVVNMAYSQMYNAGRMWSDESLSDNATTVAVWTTNVPFAKVWLLPRSTSSRMNGKTFTEA